MQNSFDPHLSDTFFSPLYAALPRAHQRRDCPSLPDADWLRFCVERVIHQEASGRGFLQRLSDRNDRSVASSTYFDANATARRLRLVREVAELVGDDWDRRAAQAEIDPFDALACLANYELFAGDGHYLAAATHDQAIDGKRRAVGHFFGMNLRTMRLFSMAMADQSAGRKREHDMHMLKRLDVQALRRGTPTGRKVIWVWDRAGIDALQWQKWKYQHGIYFISRAKDNMTLECQGALDFDANDPINAGVEDFSLVIVGGQSLRCVHYRDPITQQTFTFLSSLTEVPPGTIAALYRARWDIEKAFDETKTKLGEKKSWGSSDKTRAIQAETIVLTYNLMLTLEHAIAVQHGLRAEDDARRRRKRLTLATQQALANHATVSPTVCACWLRASQRGLRFIRWLRSMIDRNASLSLAIAKLRAAWGLQNV